MSIIHLVRDFEDVVFNYGKEKGLIFSENDRSQAVIRILNFNRKIGSKNKKTIYYAKNFKIPKEYQKRVKNILDCKCDSYLYFLQSIPQQLRVQCRVS